jgi:hypothetical protein
MDFGILNISNYDYIICINLGTHLSDDQKNFNDSKNLRQEENLSTAIYATIPL